MKPSMHSAIFLILFLIIPPSVFALNPFIFTIQDTKTDIYLVNEDLSIPSLTAKERADLTLFNSSLLEVKTDSFDLLQYQTPVKNQNPRGSCEAFAFIGAIEAFYVREYGLNSTNMHTDGFAKLQKYGITNDCSLICVTPDCFEVCNAFDLSEEYLIHIVHTVQPTNNPDVNHENICSFWSGNAKSRTTSELTSTMNLCLPMEKYAPYFGRGNEALSAYGTNHGHNDLAQIASDSNMRITSTPEQWVDSEYYTENPGQMSQKMIDDFEYDTRHIPLDARKNAVYQPTSVLKLAYTDARDTNLLEAYLVNKHEIKINLGMAKLDCGDTVYHDNTPVDRHLDGNPIAKYPVTPASFQGCTSAGCKGLFEGYDDDGDYYEPAHSMLIVGYDRTLQLFLLKNSWGNTWPYIWVPYRFVREKASGGQIIQAVRDPDEGPSVEAMWLGKWDMDHDGHKGELIIRRTRPVDQPGINTARIGSYEGSDGISHMVTGSLPANIDLFDISIDFSNSEPPPYPAGTVTGLTGQPFRLGMFYKSDNEFTHGNFATGYTTWNSIKFGTLLKRQGINLTTEQSNFSESNWIGTYRLLLNNGYEAPVEIKSISSSGNGNYRSVNCSLGQYSGNLAGLYENNAKNMFFFGNDTDLFYHGQEKGIITGVGALMLPAMKTTQDPGYYPHKVEAAPVLNTESAKASPFGIFVSPLSSMVTLSAALMATSSAMDIYMGIAGPGSGNDLMMVRPDLTLQSISEGMVKFKENNSAPIDVKIFKNIHISSFPEGEYKFYLLMSPPGDLNTFKLWDTTWTRRDKIIIPMNTLQ